MGLNVQLIRDELHSGRHSISKMEDWARRYGYGLCDEIDRLRKLNADHLAEIDSLREGGPTEQEDGK